MSPAAAILFMWSGVALLGLVGRWRLVRPSSVAGSAAGVTVVCPARDEAEVIETAVGGMVAQGADAVVVVDDRSTDATRAILAQLIDPALVVLDAPEPSPGRFGKPSALAHGVRGRTSRWWAFVDADVRLEPGALASLLALAESDRLDLVSAHPAQRLETTWEQIVMPAVFSMVLLAHPPHRVGRGGAPFANGQLLLVRDHLYRAAGGHERVSGEVLEDVALAREVALLGGRIRMVDGGPIASTRMYASWEELREGWEKNLWPLLGGRPAPALGRALLAVGLAWAGPLAFVLEPGGLGLATWMAVVVMQGILRGLGGFSWRLAPAAPVGAVAALALLLGSWRRHAGAGIDWKGRRYP